VIEFINDSHSLKTDHASFAFICSIHLCSHSRRHLSHVVQANALARTLTHAAIKRATTASPAQTSVQAMSLQAANKPAAIALAQVIRTGRRKKMRVFWRMLKTLDRASGLLVLVSLAHEFL
jgi:hypothetical protein